MRINDLLDWRFKQIGVIKVRLEICKCCRVCGLDRNSINNPIKCYY